MRIVAILASHNRRACTERCLESYFAQRTPPGWELSAVVADDASTDGTAAMIASRFPGAQLVPGTGELFWAGAMALAERRAVKQPFELLLWLNDDVVLDGDAVTRLASVAGADAIGVGALRDPQTASTTYSGVRISGRHPLRAQMRRARKRAARGGHLQRQRRAIPRLVHELVGAIDGGLGHAAADFDYGLRAKRLGIASLLCPGAIGDCERTSNPHPWADARAPRRERVAAVFGPEGYPPRSRARYLRRHGGHAWPLYWAAPYVRAIPEALGRGRP